MPKNVASFQILHFVVYIMYFFFKINEIVNYYGIVKYVTHKQSPN